MGRPPRRGNAPVVRPPHRPVAHRVRCSLRSVGRRGPTCAAGARCLRHVGIGLDMTQGSRTLAPNATLANQGDNATGQSTLPLEMLLHDLSGPSRHIGFFVKRLRSSIPDPTPRQSECFQRIEENLEDERDLLQQSRILLSDEREADTDGDMVVRANAELEDIVASSLPEFDDKGVQISLDLEGDPAVHMEPKALRRVVSNLLNNALESTPSGGVVTVGCHVEGDFVVFSVSDTGRGFTRDQADRLSQAAADFGHGGDPTDSWPGLGLLVCHRLVTRHGGTLSVSSVGPGEGSTFSCRLPSAGK